MHEVLQPIVGGALGLWFALSALAQWRPSAAWSPLGRCDVLNLITPYRFFGPNPRLEDARVSSRRLDANGPVSEWQPMWNERPRVLLDALWNPRRRASYGFAKDCWRVGEAARNGVTAEQLETSPAFQRVLNVVRHRTLGPGGAGQFEFRVSIVRFEPDQTDTEEIVFHSGSRGA